MEIWRSRGRAGKQRGTGCTCKQGAGLGASNTVGSAATFTTRLFSQLAYFPLLLTTVVLYFAQQYFTWQTGKKLMKNVFGICQVSVLYYFYITKDATISQPDIAVSQFSLDQHWSVMFLMLFFLVVFKNRFKINKSNHKVKYAFVFSYILNKSLLRTTNDSP